MFFLEKLLLLLLQQRGFGSRKIPFESDPPFFIDDYYGAIMIRFSAQAIKAGHNMFVCHDCRS